MLRLFAAFKSISRRNDLRHAYIQAQKEVTPGEINRAILHWHWWLDLDVLPAAMEQEKQELSVRHPYFHSVCVALKTLLLKVNFLL